MTIKELAERIYEETKNLGASKLAVTENILRTYLPQVVKEVMKESHNVNVSGPAKCPKCKQPKLKFVISATSNDLRMGCALGVALKCTQNGCGVFHDLCNTPDNMLQFFEQKEELSDFIEARKAFEELEKMFLLDLEMYSWPSLLDALKKHLRQPKLTDEKDDLSNSGKAFIEINEMLGTLRMFEDWPSLIKALKERLKDDGTVYVKKRDWESQNMAFNDLSMIFRFAQDSPTITEDSWKNLVRHIASMTSEAKNYVAGNAFETPKQTPVPPAAGGKPEYVASRLKELSKINELRGTVYEELFPLIIMLAEDLSEFKKRFKIDPKEAEYRSKVLNSIL